MNAHEKKAMNSGVGDLLVIVPTGSWLFDPAGATETSAGFDFLCFTDTDKINSMSRRVTWKEKGRLWNQSTSELAMVAFRHRSADVLLMLCIDAEIFESLTGAHSMILGDPEKFDTKRKRNAYLSRIAHHGDGLKHGVDMIAGHKLHKKFVADARAKEAQS
jgi:hypothetical protein